MAELRRKVAYVAGLAERYDLAESGREGKILSEVINVLRAMALDVEELRDSQRDVEDYVEEIDNDLLCLEESLYDDEDEVGDVLGDEEPDDEFGDLDDDDETYIELECPRCDQPSYYAEHLFSEDGIQLTCPHCGYIVFDSDADRLVTEEDAFDTDDAAEPAVTRSGSPGDRE
jgi:ribosomal protein S27AE